MPLFRVGECVERSHSDLPDGFTEYEVEFVDIATFYQTELRRPIRSAIDAK